MYPRQFFGLMNPFVGGVNPLAFGPVPFASPLHSPIGVNPFVAQTVGAINPFHTQGYGSPLAGYPQFVPNPWATAIGSQSLAPNSFSINPLGQVMVNPPGISPFGVNPPGAVPFGSGIPFGASPLGPVGASPFAMIPPGVSPVGVSPYGINQLGLVPPGVNPLTALNPLASTPLTPAVGINPLTAGALMGPGITGLGSTVDPIAAVWPSQTGFPIRPLITQHQLHGGLPIPAIGQFADPITASLIQSQLFSGMVHNPLLASVAHNPLLANVVHNPLLAAQGPWQFGLANPITQGASFGINPAAVQGCI